jgi:RNA polymerase sporulation-specific sigma factor
MLNEAFWTRVKRGNPDQCWEWTGALNDGKYPVTRRNYQTIYCARLVYEDTHDLKLPTDSQILHTCKNSICLNPSHLYCPRLESQTLIDLKQADRDMYAALCKTAQDQSKEGEKAFERLALAASKQLANLVRTHPVRGMSPADLSQEALILLRYQVIPSYDPSKGSFIYWTRFVIARRLVTLQVQSGNHKNRAQTSAYSLNLPSYNAGSGEADIGSFIVDGSATKPPETAEYNEESERVRNALFEKLSKMEKVIVDCYLRGQTYSQIANSLKEAGFAKTATKTVDNALTRIKKKAVRMAPHLFAEENKE